jgi:hypothetical protein
VVEDSDQQPNRAAPPDPTNPIVDNSAAELSTKRVPAVPSNMDQSAIELNVDIDIVGGPAGMRLATEQVDAILEVLEWFTRTRRST